MEAKSPKQKAQDVDTPIMPHLLKDEPVEQSSDFKVILSQSMPGTKTPFWGNITSLDKNEFLDINSIFDL